MTSQMQVRPPKQIWIGRARERRLQVKTITGEEAAERAAAEPLGADVLLQAAPQPKKKWYKRRPPQVPGVYPPRVFKPQMYPPDVNIGPGGLHVRMPQFRAPQVPGPADGPLNASQLEAGQLKLPGRGGPSAPTGAADADPGRVPPEAVAAVVADPAAARCSSLLLLPALRSLPQNVIVPEGRRPAVGVRGREEADRRPTSSSTRTRRSSSTPSAAGHGHRADAEGGREGRQGHAGRGARRRRLGKLNVPEHRRQDRRRRREGCCATKELTLGQASPQPVDPKGMIVDPDPGRGRGRQGAARRSTSSIADPADAENKKKPARRTRKEQATAAAGGRRRRRRAGGGDAAATSSCPRSTAPSVDAYAKKVADLGIVPSRKRVQRRARPARCSRPSRAGGTKVAAEVRRSRCSSPSASRRSCSPTARTSCASTAPTAPSSTRSPTSRRTRRRTRPGAPTATHVAYTADGRVMLKDLTKKNAGRGAADAGRPTSTTTSRGRRPPTAT